MVFLIAGKVYVGVMWYFVVLQDISFSSFCVFWSFLAQHQLAMLSRIVEDILAKLGSAPILMVANGEGCGGL